MKDRDRLVKEKLVKIVVVPVVHMIVAKIVMKKSTECSKRMTKKIPLKKTRNLSEIALKNAECWWQF